jgi:hypothetical protein
MWDFFFLILCLLFGIIIIVFGFLQPYFNFIFKHKKFARVEGILTSYKVNIANPTLKAGIYKYEVETSFYEVSDEVYLLKPKILNDKKMIMYYVDEPNNSFVINIGKDIMSLIIGIGLLVLGFSLFI